MTSPNTILITGGAGFVGSNLALAFKRDGADGTRVVAFDNLKRRGSELNLPRLRDGGVDFVHGDIRNPEDLVSVGKSIDLIIDCSAEPSVSAGLDGSSRYLVNTNLGGTVNCLEFAREVGAAIVFLSTSRVYPIASINNLNFDETETRFVLKNDQNCPGVSAQGISEEFPLSGIRSLYGTTKLCSELLLQEYAESFKIPVIINRCGVLAGSWQMGKVDQGFLALWVARHIYGKPIRYIGFGGKGKQVRDVLHVEDLYSLLKIQVAQMSSLSGQVFNVGGGSGVNTSLCELTKLCEQSTGSSVLIGFEPDTRPTDIKWYLSDIAKVKAATGWKPEKSVEKIVEETTRWIVDKKELLRPVFCY